MANFVIEGAKLVWARLTLSKVTIAYIIFTIVHCIIQVSLQGEAFATNNAADSFLKQITRSAHKPTPTGINVLAKNGPLYLCRDAPSGSWNGCDMIWSPRANVAVSTQSTDGAYTATGVYAEMTTSGVSPSPVYTTSSTTPSPTVTKSTDPTTTSISTKTKHDNDDIEKGDKSSHTSTTDSATPTLTGASIKDIVDDLEEVDSDDVTVEKDDKGNVAIHINKYERSEGIVGATSSFEGFLAWKKRDDVVVEVPSINAFLSPDFKRDEDDIVLPIGISEDSFISSSFRRHLGRRSLKVGAANFDSDGNLVSVPISGLSAAAISKVPGALASSNQTGTVDISPTCVDVLAWPLQKLATSGREDVVFLVFNIWVLGMSFVALLNESMPHMIAAVITHIMLTAWTAFQVYSTASFRSEFLRITLHGACPGINLLPNYWNHRQNVEIAELVLNIGALIVSLFLTWRLVKQFGWQTFKRVGASLSVNAMYKLVLGLSVVLQLSLFFIVASIALWIEQICSGPARTLTKNVPLYEGFYLVIIILLVPWAAMGWFGVRRENKILTHLFLFGAMLVILAWGGMFFSNVFRLLFVTWGFFALMTVVAMGMSGITLILGVACRLKFGKHSKILASYLRTDEEIAPEKDVHWIKNTEYEHGEKFEFPASEIPSYEAMMQRANGGSTVTPITVPIGARTRSGSAGSSFSSHPTSPSDKVPDYSPRGASPSPTITQPSPTLTRSGSTTSSISGGSYITRINTRGSNNRGSPGPGPSRYDGVNSGVAVHKTWVIE